MSAQAVEPSIDVVTRDILRGQFDAVAREMASTLANATQSPRVSTARAFACAVLDEQARVVAIDNVLHLASAGEAAAHALDYYEFATSADDVIVTNDPYSGGMAVHCLSLIAPVGFDGDIVGHVVVQIQVEDIGGVVRGNLNPRATELWAEGIRFIPIKLVVDGRRRRDVFDTLVLNSRDPERFRGDIDAALATLETGRRRLSAIIAERGLGSFTAGMEGALAYAETRMRAAIATIPPGRHEGAATLDHDGQGRRDLRIRVALEARDDRLHIDFAGTGEQSDGFVNSPLTNTLGHALLPLISVVGGDLERWNDGLLRPLELDAAVGTLVNPRFPAPTAWCGAHVGYEITTAVRFALSSALGGHAVPAGYSSRPLTYSVRRSIRAGGVEEQSAITDLATLGQAGEPAQPTRDGWGAPGPASRSVLPSVEEFELVSPARVVRLEYAVDSGGVGQFRGAPGTETVVAFPEGDDERLFALLPGVRNRDAGVAGGGPGAAAGLSVVGPEGEEPLPDSVYDSPAGRLELSLRFAGGGGFGPARERRPEAVLADVRAGLVSADSARRDYGIST